MAGNISTIGGSGEPRVLPELFIDRNESQGCEEFIGSVKDMRGVVTLRSGIKYFI